MNRRDFIQSLTATIAGLFVPWKKEEASEPDDYERHTSGYVQVQKLDCGLPPIETDTFNFPGPQVFRISNYE